jgi:hypothetical protein
MISLNSESRTDSANHLLSEAFQASQAATHRPLQAAILQAHEARVPRVPQAETAKGSLDFVVTPQIESIEPATLAIMFCCELLDCLG